MSRIAITFSIAFGLCVGGVATADVGTSHNGNGGAIPVIDVDFGETHNTYPFAFGVDEISGTHFTKDFGEIGVHSLSYAYELVQPIANIPFPFPILPEVYEPNDADLELGLAGMGVDETITNSTGQAWAQYQFTLRSADFYVKCSTNGGVACEGGFNDVINLLTAQENGELTVSDIMLDEGMFPDATVFVERDEGADPDVIEGDEETIVLLDFGSNPLLNGESFDVGFLLNLSGYLNDGPTSTGFEMDQQPIPIPVPGAAGLALVGFGVIGWVRRRNQQR